MSVKTKNYLFHMMWLCLVVMATYINNQIEKDKGMKTTTNVNTRSEDVNAIFEKFFCNHQSFTKEL